MARAREFVNAAQIDPSLKAVLNIMLDEIGAATDSDSGDVGTAVGAAAGANVVASESGSGGIHRTVLTFTNRAVAIADDAGVAQYGGAGKIYDFPEGVILPLGVTIDGSITLGTTGTITNTWAGGVAVGSAAATTGSTLASTEADIMAEVDVAAATSKVASVDAQSATNKTPLDGSATPVDAYLNLVVDDDATHTAGTGTFTGTVTIVWVNLGDN